MPTNRKQSCERYFSFSAKNQQPVFILHDITLNQLNLTPGGIAFAAAAGVGPEGACDGVEAAGRCGALVGVR